MQTLEALNRKIETAEDLLSVVKTMKSLAAVNIRQYERAVESLEEYKQIVDSGWEVLLRFGGPVHWEIPGKSAVYLIFGSDQGMCGQFNEAIVTHALEEIERLKQEGLQVKIWVVGEKVIGAMMDAGYEISEPFSVPGSLNSINAEVQTVVQTIESWRSSPGLERMYVCHNMVAERGGYGQTFYRLLPLDEAWAKPYRDRKWPGRCLPLLGLPQQDMFAHLLRQYLFVSFFRAFAQSLAAENAARLISMQAAEKNILDLKEELLALFREQRQATITNELLDIVSGFEALSEEANAV
jgi:F-type H+-transporting ATPase subunit gamma